MDSKKYLKQIELKAATSESVYFVEFIFFFFDV